MTAENQCKEVSLRILYIDTVLIVNLNLLGIIVWLYEKFFYKEETIQVSTTIIKI